MLPLRAPRNRAVSHHVRLIGPRVLTPCSIVLPFFVLAVACHHVLSYLSLYAQSRAAMSWISNGSVRSAGV